MGEKSAKEILLALNAARQKLLMERQDNELYNNFVQSAPSNLRNPNPQGPQNYNMRGYWESLGKPQSFDYSQPLEDDGRYHATSRNPQTGEILKFPNHPTFKIALMDDIKMGYNPYISPQGKIYTIKKGDAIPQGFVPYMF
jgi:hypothetical protein